jgi:hypothetical protein
MLALSIRQPYAELILRGIKTCELRSRGTKVVEQRFYIYAPKKRAQPPVWSSDLEVAAPPPWMLELAQQVGMLGPDAQSLIASLPTGVIVGSAVIEKVSQPAEGLWQWHLAGVQRANRLRKPQRQPQPVWFRPF